MFGKVSLDARGIEREEKEEKVFNVKKKTKIGRKENSEMLKKDAKERKGRGKHLEFQARCCDVCDEFEECECACAAMTRAHLPNLPLTR